MESYSVTEVKPVVTSEGITIPKTLYEVSPNAQDEVIVDISTDAELVILKPYEEDIFDVSVLDEGNYIIIMF